MTDRSQFSDVCADPVTYVSDMKEPVLDYYPSQRRREKLNEIRFVENKLNTERERGGGSRERKEWGEEEDKK